MKEKKVIGILIVLAFIIVAFVFAMYIEKLQSDVDNEVNSGKRILVEAEKHHKEEYRFSNGSIFITEDMIKSIEWATTEAYNETIKLKVYIQDAKVYYEYDGKTKQIKSIKGLAKNVVQTIGGGTDVFEVLTEDGKVWEAYTFEPEEIDSFEVVEELKTYNITRLATLHFEDITDQIYYETSDGKLIDYDGFTIEEKNKNLLDRYGMVVCLEIGENGKLGYFNGDEIVSNYNAVKSADGKNINAKRIYSYVKGDGYIRYIVVTDKNKLYELQLSYQGQKVDIKVADLSQKNTVKDITCYTQNNQCMAEFKMSNNTAIVKNIGDSEGVCDYYNAETFETVELK